MRPSSEAAELDGALQRFLHQFPADAKRALAAQSFLATTANPPTARTNMQGHFTASALVLNPAGDATLLIFHKRLQRWLQPGGHIEPGESPVDAASREAYEELGIHAGALRLHPWHHAHKSATPVDIDSHPIPANATKNETAHTHHDLLYLFVLDPATPLSIERQEVDAAQWVPLTQLPAGDRLGHVASRAPVSTPSTASMDA